MVYVEAQGDCLLVVSWSGEGNMLEASLIKRH